MSLYVSPRHGEYYRVEIISSDPDALNAINSAFIATDIKGQYYGASTKREKLNVPEPIGKPSIFADNRWFRLYAKSMGKVFEVLSLSDDRTAFKANQLNPVAVEQCGEYLAIAAQYRGEKA